MYYIIIKVEGLFNYYSNVQKKINKGLIALDISEEDAVLIMWFLNYEAIICFKNYLLFLLNV